MSAYVCSVCEAPVANALDRYDIRIEARRADGNDRPNAPKVDSLCRQHKDELFAAIDSGRVFFILDPVNSRVVVHVQQGLL